MLKKNKSKAKGKDVEAKTFLWALVCIGFKTSHSN